MKKNILLKIVLILVAFFAFDNVYAESCSTKELNTLKQKATNIKTSYELHDATYNESHMYYFDILLANFGNEFYIVDLDGQEFQYITDLEKDGVRNLRVVREGTRYGYTIYTSNETKCPNTKIITKTIEIPYYNDYSQREECKGIEEFSLCQEYYGGLIESDDYFKQQVEKYKKGLIKDDGQKENDGIFGKIISLISNNILVSCLIAVIVVIISVIVIINLVNRKKKKVKIKI